MTLKSTFERLCEPSGGPYGLIKKGIKRGVIQSIMRGSTPKANELYEVAKILGVTVEYLLTEKEPAQSEPRQLPLMTETEHELVEDLLMILRGRNKSNAEAIKSNVKAFAATSDYIPAAEPDKKKKLPAPEKSYGYGVEKKKQNS